MLSALLLSFFLHLPFVNEPPYSQHTWRQSTTLAVASNYYNENMNLLLPRLDHRDATNGVTGMHFPLYEWVVANIYQVTGEAFYVHRLVSFVFYCAGTWGIFELLLLLFSGNVAALVGAFTYLWSPELFFNGFIGLPDTAALPFVVWALYFFSRWFLLWKQGISANRWLWISALLFCTGGLIKLQYLGAGLFAVGLLWPYRKEFFQRKNAVLLAVFATVSVVPVLAWYSYSKQLIARSGLADIGLELKPAESLQAGLRILTRNITGDLPETLLNWVGTLFFIAGITWFIQNKKWKSPFFPAFLFFSVGYAFYHLLELRVLQHHQYYMMPYFPVLCAVAGFGGKWLLEKKKTGLLVILLAGQVVVCCARILPSRFANTNKMIPEEFYIKEKREALQQLVPDTAKVITGPDESATIYLFYVNKTGWNFYRTGMLWEAEKNSRPYLENAIRQGCRYLYTSDTTLPRQPQLQPYVLRETGRVGNFTVLELHIPGDR